MTFIQGEKNAKTAFGELRAEQGSPLAQISAQYGLLGQVLTLTDTLGSGSTSAEDNLFKCQTGTDPDGLASILSLRQVGVRSGQGSLSRLDAVFSPPVLDSVQTVGLITSENSYVFGFIGLNFGIIYTRDGVSEVQELTVTTPAGGAESATITVDGNPITVPLTAGTVQHNAFEIANSLTAQVANYSFTSNNDEVVAQSSLPGPRGSFAFSSATAVAAWAQIVPGATGSTTFIPQAQWNVDTRLEGGAPRVLDPTKGNLYQIQINSNFGSVSFYIEDNDTSDIVLVHQIKTVNLSTTPNTANPTFRMGWFVQNLGNTSNIILTGSSSGSFVEGMIHRNSSPRSAKNDQLAVGTALTNILTVRNRITFGGKVNRAEVFSNLIAASSQANKPTFFLFLVNATFAGDLDFAYVSKSNSLMEVATDSVGVSGGLEIGSLTVVAGAPQTLRFNQTPGQDTILLPGQVLTIAAQVSSGAGGDMQSTFTWAEDL